MSDFPRALRPSGFGMPVPPFALRSEARGGNVRTSGTLARGWRWTETWDLESAADPVFMALVAWIERAIGTGLYFQVANLATPGSGMAPNGTETLTPLVAGAGQTGAEIVVDGLTPGMRGALRAGDMIRVGSLLGLRRVAEDVDAESDGTARIAVFPGFTAREAPPDNAPIILRDNLFRATIMAYEAAEGSAPSTMRDMSVTFKET